MAHRLLSFFAVFLLVALAHAENWPGWRGADGQGQCLEKGLPLTWDAKTNVRWKVPLPDQGSSTPIVWGDRIFMTQASEKSLWPAKGGKGGQGGPAIARKRSLWCLDRLTGKVLWQKDVIYEEKESTHPTNPYCSASPVTDGERVVVSHGSAGMFCYDFTGKELWKVDVGKLEHDWGNASSPVLYGDLVIQWCGPGERVFLLAVNKKTGDKVWQHDEPSTEAKDYIGSWSTPIVVKVKGQDQLILGIARTKGADPKLGALKGIDPKTGKELWACAGLGPCVYSSPLLGRTAQGDDVAVQFSGFSGPALAVKLGGAGDITKDRLWHHAKANPQRIGSGVIVGEHVYMFGENGTPQCFELTTGKQVWEIKDRPGGGAWGSLVHADGRLYICCRDGSTLVFAADPKKFELLATNRLNEHVDASVAVSNGDIFIRSFKHLWCIGGKEKQARQRATDFLTALGAGNVNGLRDFYAPKVLIKAGSELLHAKWGLNPSNDRGKDLEVDREQILGGYAKLFAKVGDKWTTLWTQLLATEQCITMKVAEQADVPFGGVKQGDLIVKVVPRLERDDAFYYVLRADAMGKWCVVAEGADY